MVRCGAVRCGAVWCGAVWCGVVWCGVVWCGVVWCGVVWCGVVWCLCVSSSCTEKRFRVYVQNAPVCTFKTPVPHGTRVRFERSHGSVFKVAAPSLPLSSCVSLLVSLSLSPLIVSHSFSIPLSITMTVIARPVGSLCTFLPEGQGAWAMHGPFLVGLTCSHHARNNCPSVLVQASCHLE